MNPTTPPAPTPADPQALQAVVELVRAQRSNLASVLMGASVVCLALTFWLGVRSSQFSPSSPTTDEKEKDKDKAEDLFKPAQLEATEGQQQKRQDYIFGAVVAFGACVAFGAVGGYLLSTPPRGDAAAGRTEARLVLLVLGGAVGMELIFGGALFFYQWSGSLVKWLDQGEVEEARWVVIPLLMAVLGGALMFVSAQPARAEERNNPRVRRFIYGSNFGLTILMMFVMLVVVNAVVALRVPNRLDTTGSGFYTLSPQTKQLLEGLDQPIQAYALFQDSGDLATQDIKRLLQSCQDVNPKFQVTVLSPALNKQEIAKLRADYPQAQVGREGVLLVAGEDGTRHLFIRSDEFEDVKTDQQGRQTPVFNGEPRLLRDLMFLAENKQKPKVYFTQSSGELALSGAGSGPRTAAGLKQYLVKSYIDVQELRFDPQTPAKVPDDAAVVVVADPTAKLPDAGVEAIRKYMTEARADGRKGKLVVLAGAQAGTDEKPLKTGLEPVLQSFGVALSDRFLYYAPDEDRVPRDPEGGARVSAAEFTEAAVRARNTVAVSFPAGFRLPLLDCREVRAGPGGGQGATTVPVLATVPGSITWTQPEVAGRGPVAAWVAINTRARQISRSDLSAAEKEKQQDALAREFELSAGPRNLAVFASEGNTGRVAVIGCGWFVSDAMASTARGGSARWYQLMGATLDWVRDRPTVTGVQEKKYDFYTLPPKTDTLRMIWVPLALAVFTVAGFGAGVWVVRRK